MPKIKRFKTYPFPFLAEYTKDYKKTKFILNLHYTSEKGMVKFQADYSINNDELVESIKDGTIEVAVKIVCRRMGFSKTFEVLKELNSIEVSYDSMQFEGDVEVKAFLVAKYDFTLENVDLSDAWINERPTVQADNVIGESNERVVTITHMKSGSSKSIFKFAFDLKKPDDAPYSIDLTESDCIVFKLSKRTYRQFESIRHKGREFVYTLYVIPTIADILRQMINEKVPEGEEVINNDFNVKHANKRWYIVLSENYERAFNGADPTEGTIHPLEAAQTIIDRYAVGNMLTTAKRAKL